MKTSKQAVKEEATMNAWTPMEAMSTLLTLASAQTKLSLKEAGTAVQTLTQTWMEMIRYVHEIKALAEESKSKDVVEPIIKQCDQFLDHVQAGTVGFQFYDRLSQRLVHMSDGLEEAKMVIESPDTFLSGTAWEELFTRIKARYNMEKDRQLYESLLAGKSIAEALRDAEKAGNNEVEPSGDIELF